MKKLAAILLAVTALAGTRGALLAQSTALSYQGYLADEAGPASGEFDFRFSLFTGESGGTAVATTTQPGVAVSNGLFATSVDFGSDLSRWDGTDYWLGIEVQAGGGGGYVGLSPRQPLRPVPYAFWAATAMNLANPSFLGTTTATPLELFVNDRRALRLEPTGDDTAVNLVGGAAANAAAAGVVGATIAGGGTAAEPNVVEGDYATIGGGRGNYNAGPGATIGGGESNLIDVSATNAVIAGGFRNTAEVEASGVTIGGGWDHYIINAFRATIAGGEYNSIYDYADYAVVGGGFRNTIEYNAIGSVIGGGWDNYITNAFRAVITGGEGNTIDVEADYATIGGGQSNTIYEMGYYATIPGGGGNAAAGQYSLAAGHRAQAWHDGSFVWADATDADLPSSAVNEFTVRASGGVRFFTDAGASVGVELEPSGTGWKNLSDRNLKENFEPVDVRVVLEKVVAMPIQRWNMKTQDPSIRHIGPMAQDFHAAFELGQDERHINSVDADGVALAAIQGLNQKLEDKNAQIQSLQERVAELERQLRQLAGRPGP